MCGLFNITPKAAPKSSKPNHKSGETSSVPLLYRHTPTHVRVDAIMGVPSSYRVYDSATIRVENEKRRAKYPSKNNSSNSSIASNKSDTPANGHNSSNNGVLRPKSLNNLKYETTNMNGTGGPPIPSPSHMRPRMYERRKYPSSPLANTGTEKIIP